MSVTKQMLAENAHVGIHRERLCVNVYVSVTVRVCLAFLNTCYVEGILLCSMDVIKYIRHGPCLQGTLPKTNFVTFHRLLSSVRFVLNKLKNLGK